jgi:hypothetical protein
VDAYAVLDPGYDTAGVANARRSTGAELDTEDQPYLKPLAGEDRDMPEAAFDLEPKDSGD